MIISLHSSQDFVRVPWFCDRTTDAKGETAKEALAREFPPATQAISDHGTAFWQRTCHKPLYAHLSHAWKI